MLKTATLNVSLRANKTAIINKNLFMNVLWVIVNFNLFPKQMKTGKGMKNCEGLEGWYLIPPKMQKNGIQLVWRIPQYHNWILKLPKYCKKKTPILQTLVSPSWDVTIISLTSIKAQMRFLSVSHLSRPSTFSVFSVILFISPSVPSPPPPPPPPKKNGIFR